MEELLRKLKEKIAKSLEAFREELKSIRSGRAEVGLVDMISVDVYGSHMPIKELATISVPEPRQIVVTPWDKGTLSAIEKAIRISPAGLAPILEANFVRINIPPLTSERREELIKLLGQKEENFKVALRNIRHEVMKDIEQMEKDKLIGEDDQKRGEKEVQAEMDNAVKQARDLTERKTAEIREV